MNLISFVLRKFKLNRVITRLARIGFNLFQKVGIHITPNHYYWPIPDTSKLKPELWERESEMAGIDLNESDQRDILHTFENKYRSEYEQFPLEPTDIAHQYYVNNRDFGAVDGEILYCMIRHFKPAKIIEIGSGHSTYLSAQALLKNEEAAGKTGELIAIEPYPRGALVEGFPGLTKYIRSRVQDVDLQIFLELKENDILFIDSSHILAIGSDVQYEYTEILPRLKRGVLIHIHDIFLPKEYPQEWVYNLFRFWNEQYLLQAFLSFNDYFKIIWAGSHMHLKNPELLENAFPTYDRKVNHPGSIWIRRVK